MNTLLADLAECNYAQLYYGTELVGGSKASFKISFNQIYNDTFGNLGVESGWTFTLFTVAGNYTYTASTDIVDTFVDGAMTALIANITSTTNIDLVYDMTIGNSTQSYGEILFTAKTIGSIYTLQSFSSPNATNPNEAEGVIINNVAGNDANPTSFINVIPNTSEFMFKKKENEPLFQLECEFIETSTSTRQKL